jgi:hypothetical protein
MECLNPSPTCSRRRQVSPLDWARLCTPTIPGKGEANSMALRSGVAASTISSKKVSWPQTQFGQCYNNHIWCGIPSTPLLGLNRLWHWALLYKANFLSPQESLIELGSPTNYIYIEIMINNSLKNNIITPSLMIKVIFCKCTRRFAIF